MTKPTVQTHRESLELYGVDFIEIIRQMPRSSQPHSRFLWITYLTQTAKNHNNKIDFFEWLFETFEKVSVTLLPHYSGEDRVQITIYVEKGVEDDNQDPN